METRQQRSVKPRRLFALALLGLAVVCVAVLVAGRIDGTSSSGRAAAPLVGKTISITLDCGSPVSCEASVKGENGASWEWEAGPNVAVPPAWRGRAIDGLLDVASEWGTAKFHSDGQVVDMFGGLQDIEAGHTFTAVG